MYNWREKDIKSVYFLQDVVEDEETPFLLQIKLCQYIIQEGNHEKSYKQGIMLIYKQVFLFLVYTRSILISNC